MEQKSTNENQTMSNGDNILKYWPVLIVILGGFSTITGYVVANENGQDSDNVAIRREIEISNVEIRKEYKESDERIADRLEKKIEENNKDLKEQIRTEVNEVKSDFRELQKEQTVMKVQQTEILTILKEVDKKIKK